MIIDLILDRKGGSSYKAKEFYIKSTKIIPPFRVEYELL